MAFTCRALCNERACGEAASPSALLAAEPSGIAAISDPGVADCVFFGVALV